MSSTFAIVSIVLIAAIIIASSVGQAVKPIGLTLLTLLAAFCVFGFLAAFEPGSGHLSFKLLYASAGLSCLVSGVKLAWPSGSKTLS